MELKVINQNTGMLEDAKVMQCPRCRGFGRVSGDDEPCFLCSGEGEVIRSESGWTQVISENGEVGSQLW